MPSLVLEILFSGNDQHPGQVPSFIVSTQTLYFLIYSYNRASIIYEKDKQETN